MNLKAIIDRLGGESAVASELGIGPSAISNWKRRDRIPPGQIFTLRDLARKRGVALTEDELRGVASPATYERDFYAWTQEQASLLRAGAVDRADLENIAEEIESMGRSEKRELVSRLSVLLLHLLKWRYQPTFRGASWRLTIKEQRYQIDDLLNDNPSLKAQIAAATANAYRLAKVSAQRDTGIGEDVFPDSCPFAAEQIMDERFLPE